MSKFNRVRTEKRKVVNHEGHANYKKLGDEVKNEIADIVLTSMLNGDSYYESEENRINRVFNLVKNNKNYAEFFMKAMIFGRTQAYLRSISHVLACALVENVKGNKYLKKSLKRIILRPDDASEIVALHMSRENYKLPNSLRKAIRENLEEKWDLYQFRKYRMKNREIKLVDLVNLTHPREYVWQKNFNLDDKPFYMITQNKLPKIETAETINTFKKDEDRKQAYYDLIRKRKLGYMAFIKNLDKMLPETDNEVDLVVSYLTDTKLINKSMLLPKRFLVAYFMIKDKQFKGKNKVLKALEYAFVIRTKDLNVISENKEVSIVIDTSSSMVGEPLNNAVALAAMLYSIRPDVNVYAFASDYKKLDTFGLSPFAFVEKYFEFRYHRFTPKFDIGWSTEIISALNAITDDKYTDYVFVLTDMQLYDSWNGVDKTSMQKLFKKYKNLYKKIPEKVIFWDLEGYNRGTPLRENGDTILSITGYSDKVVENLNYVLNKGKLLDKIEEIVL